MFAWQLLFNPVWQFVHFAQTNVFCNQPISKKIIFPNLDSPHLLPLLERKYSGYFVLPALPNYSAHTSLGPINKYLFH